MDEEVLLKYDGPALREHRMDVRDLAPALMGLADAVSAAGKAVDPNSNVGLKVSAHAEGSFEVQMIIEAAQNVGLLLVGTHATILANGVTIGEAVAKSIRGALRIAALIVPNGGKPVAPEGHEGQSHFEVVYPNGTEVSVTGMDWIVFSDGKAMAGLEKVVDPLRAGVIDDLSFKALGETTTVDYKQRDGFAKNYRSEIVSDDSARIILEVTKPNFGGTKWTVTDGAATFTVDIEDQSFLDRVSNRDILFGSGDSIQAMMRTTQTIESGALRISRVIERVERVLNLNDE